MSTLYWYFESIIISNEKIKRDLIVFQETMFFTLFSFFWVNCDYYYLLGHWLIVTETKYNHVNNDCQR